MSGSALLILDEPINGLDAEGMKMMREILMDITQNCSCTALIASHIPGEMEKIATHYGVIGKGRMPREMTAEELERDCRICTALKAEDMARTGRLLEARYARAEGFDNAWEKEGVKRRFPYLDREARLMPYWTKNLAPAAGCFRRQLLLRLRVSKYRRDKGNGSDGTENGGYLAPGGSV